MPKCRECGFEWPDHKHHEEDQLRARVAELEHDLAETHVVLRGAIQRGGELLGERDRYRGALEAIHRNDDPGSPAWKTAAEALNDA